jgi:hypothetical protein
LEVETRQRAIAFAHSQFVAVFHALAPRRGRGMVTKRYKNQISAIGAKVSNKFSKSLMSLLQDDTATSIGFS